MTTENNYWALSKISLGFKILGWLAVGLGAFCFVVILIWGGGPNSQRIYSLVALLVGFFYFLFLYALGEMINLFIAIERNTRRPSDT